MQEGGPMLVRFITQVASRFGIVVTQKVAAQALPVIGALGGGAVDYFIHGAFLGARAVTLRFEGSSTRTSKELVRSEYEQINTENPEPDSPAR